MSTTNLSKLRRERMLAFLEKIREKHTDDESLIAINEIENELTEKKYGLVWEEHEEDVDVQMRDNIPVFTEVKDKEIVSDENLPYNFLLEGDNLHSLKLLEKTHKGKIDVIYIDPPYNTGKDDDEQSGCFMYDDAFVDANDMFIHSKWLSFMNNRLKIAKELLAKDGVIFISIGKEENASLRILCDEIFGEENILGQIVRRTKTTSFRGNYFALRVDYILCYCKGNGYHGKFMDVVDKSKYTKIEIKGKYKGQMYKDDTAFYLSTLETRPNQRYWIECPDGELVIPPGTTFPTFDSDGEKALPNDGDGVWRWEVEQYKSKRDFLSFKKTTRSPLLTLNGRKAHWNIYTKSYYCDKEKDGNIPPELLLDFINRNGTEELKKMGIKFSFPKPVSLLSYLIQITNKPKNITVLDFFAGSGTTGHAVLNLNQLDNGDRKFILCTNNENNICEHVTYQRIKTVITGMRQDGTTYSPGISANLKYYKTDFIPKISNDGDSFIEDKLLNHIAEMIQLEHAIKLDNIKYALLLSDKQADDFINNPTNLEKCKEMYISSSVLLTGKQQQLIDEYDIITHIVPDYYFENELIEVDER